MGQETNTENAGEVEEGSGGKGAEGAKATPWEAAAKGCCRVKSDILVEEPKTPKRFSPASKNHWNPRQFISASDPMGLEQCVLGCPSGTPVPIWGKEVRNKARKNMQDDRRANGPKMLITSSPTSSPIWLRKCKYKKGTLKLEIK